MGIEIFDILTHKTVSNEDFKLEDETEFCVCKYVSTANLNMNYS